MSRMVASTAINVGIQIAGSVLPALLMIITFPVMKAGLSAASFATFALLFTALSFMNVLDVGLGRSVTYFAARYLQQGRPRDALGSLWAAMAIGLAMSLAILGLLWIADTVWSARPGRNVGIDFHPVFRLAWFLPIFIGGALLRGFLDAEQRFLASNSVQLVYGATLAFAPLVVIHFTTDIGSYPVVFGLIRTAMVLAYLLLIRRTQPGVLVAGLHDSSRLSDVLRYARWLFVSNLLGIAIVYADRIAVAAGLPAELVSAYVVPMELVLRGQILIGALSTVLFPMLVRVADRGSGELLTGAVCGQFVIFGGVLLVAAVVSGFAPWVLEKWMGKAFSLDATLIARVAILGLAPIGCANLATTVLHAQGRTAYPAALYAIELPLYSLALWLAARTGNATFIVGSWLGRLCFDMAGAQYLLLRQSSRGYPLWLWQQPLFLAAAVGYFVLMAQGGGGILSLLAFGALGALMMLGGLRLMPGSLLKRTRAPAVH
jgi:O-antigen/teichoic acid export membrane protein